MHRVWPEIVWIVRHGESVGNVALDDAVRDGLDRIALATRDADRVPAHRDLVLAAMAAGKHVYCESPLGSSLDEAAEMAAAVGSGHVAIGLQSRFNPAARRAAQIVAEGRIGCVLNARAVSTTSGFGPVTLQAYTYFERRSSGANIVTVTGGHTLDLIESVLGDVAEIEAGTPTLWPNPSVADGGGAVAREVPDHCEIVGAFASGAVFGASVVGGVPPEQARFLLEVRGSDGWLTLSGGHPYGVQAGTLTLASSAAFDPPDAPLVTGGLLGAATNVAEVYASLARDIARGTRETPCFERALRNQRLTAAVALAGASGERQVIA